MIGARYSWEEQPLHELPFAAIDLETTGFAPPQAKITEVAIIFKENGEEKVWKSLVDPGVPIPDKIVQLNGITDEMVNGQPKIGEILPEILRILENKIFVSHNVPFDWSFLEHETKKLSGRLLNLPSLCTLQLSRKYLRLQSNSLTSVASFLGIRLENAHRAEDDTLAVRDICRKLMEILAEKGFRTGKDLVKNRILRTTPPPCRW